MTRVLAILAHPKKDSLNGHIFYTVVEHLKKKNIEVDVLDLYDHAEEIPLFITDQKKLEQNSFYCKNRELFLAADRLFIVYPVYWYSVPGILKCWIDIITNFAWKYEGGNYAKPLHQIKKALVINTASISPWFRWFCTYNSASEMLKQTFKWMGINKYYFYEINSANKLTVPQVAQHIRYAIKKIDWLVS